MDGTERDCADVLGLGENKPMGFLPLSYFGEWTKISVEDAEAEAAKRQIATRRVSVEECGIGGGALYAWSPPALGELLGKYRDVVVDAGWPTEVEAFVARCVTDWVADDHPMRMVIAHAFGALWEVEELFMPGPR